MHKDSVLTSQRTQFDAITHTAELCSILFYCKNPKEHQSTVCEQNIKFLNVRAGGTHCYHWAPKS